MKLRQNNHNNLALELATSRLTEPALVTWLNHYSAQLALPAVGERLLEFTHVGIDGKLLQWIVGAQARTSADLVLPVLLPLCRGARVGIIGGTVDGSEARAAAVAELLSPDALLALNLDGYIGVSDGNLLANLLQERNCDVVLIGMGAGLQEQTALRVREALPNSLVLTCGGWMDQLVMGDYYPPWAYPLRLNWLVRLLKEPQRLWRRYTVYAARALIRARELRTTIRSLPGVTDRLGMGKSPGG